MEDILDLYHLPPDPRRPLVCMDEVCVQFLAHADEPLPPVSGHVAKQDYEYIRKGSGSVFLAVAPHQGRRLTYVSEAGTRKAQDYAEFLKRVAEAFPKAEEIVLVQDNLNTHSPASLYKTFSAPKARQLARQFDMRFTPKHGSWLNIAEAEISVLARQCLARRIANTDTLRKEVEAWTKTRNKHSNTTKWQFTADDARMKLKSLYPSF